MTTALLYCIGLGARRIVTTKTGGVQYKSQELPSFKMEQSVIKLLTSYIIVAGSI